MPANRVRSFVRSALTPSRTPAGRPARRGIARAFLAARDEAAFAALVRRHGPMVLAVCRAILRDQADADDAFQATFLVLVRRAAVIRDRAALGGWLYAVAGRAARRLRASARRNAPLPEDLLDRTTGIPEVTSDIRAILDEEVARLPEVYRLAVQVCYVTGRTTAEAAALLGWAKGTVLTRLAWARRRLRSRLAARGVGLAVGAFGTVLGRPAAFAVGRALCDEHHPRRRGCRGRRVSFGSRVGTNGNLIRRSDPRHGAVQAEMGGRSDPGRVVGRGRNRAVGIGRRAGLAASSHKPSNCPRNPAGRRPADGATVPREQTRSRR